MPKKRPDPEIGWMDSKTAKLNCLTLGELDNEPSFLKVECSFKTWSSVEHKWRYFEKMKVNKVQCCFDFHFVDKNGNFLGELCLYCVSLGFRGFCCHNMAFKLCSIANEPLFFSQYHWHPKTALLIWHLWPKSTNREAWQWPKRSRDQWSHIQYTNWRECLQIKWCAGWSLSTFHK